MGYAVTSIAFSFAVNGTQHRLFVCSKRHPEFAGTRGSRTRRIFTSVISSVLWATHEKGRYCSK